MPQQKHEAHLEARLRRNRPQDVQLGRPATGPPQQRAEQLGEGPDPIGEAAVQHGHPGRPEHPPVTGSFEQIVGNQVRRLEEIACADQLSRDPVAGAGLEHDQSVKDQQAGALPRGGEPRAQITLADSELDELGRGELPGGDATPGVQLPGELVVCVAVYGYYPVPGKPMLAYS